MEKPKISTKAHRRKGVFKKFDGPVHPCTGMKRYASFQVEGMNTELKGLARMRDA